MTKTNTNPVGTPNAKHSTREENSSRMKTRKTSIAVSLALCSWLSTARADDVEVSGERITLAMILPALAGTELGSLDLGASPQPGRPMWVRASDVRAALRRDHRDDRGLSIPSRTRVLRPVRLLDAKELERLARDSLQAVLAPCKVESIAPLEPQTLAAGEVTVTAVAEPPRTSGRVAFQLTVTQSSTSSTQHAQAVVECPPAVVAAGATLRLVATVGAVKVVAPGVAGQAGRVGDEIRVTNSITRKALKARVLDAQSAEVLQ